MTIIRRSYRIDTIKNRRSRRIATRATFFLQSTKHTISRKRQSHLFNQKLSKTSTPRKIIFNNILRKTSKVQNSKKILTLKIPERNSVQQKVAALRRTPRCSLHRDILKKTKERRDILALQSPQRKSKVFSQINQFFP